MKVRVNRKKETEEDHWIALNTPFVHRKPINTAFTLITHYFHMLY